MYDRNSLRALILLGSDRDAKSMAATLALSGVTSYCCGDVAELCAELSKGAGALLVNGEVLGSASRPLLAASLAQQPSWSHLPIVTLLDGSDLAGSLEPAFRELETLGNVTLLEGPVRLGTLVSTVRASIAYRKRQYQQRDLLAQLEASRREAVEANRAKSDFLANMSHEIRTPLGAVMGFSELLMEAGTSDREKQVYMTTIRRNGQLLSALIDDILDLAKVESGRLEIDHLEFSLTELTAEIVDSLAPLANKKDLEIVLERSPGTPDLVRGDPIRLKQILVNIVGNALKFTSQGHVTLRVGGQPDAEGTGGFSLTFEVEDTGIGISATQKARLFQPFTQVDTSSTRRFGGTGLGLVLSRKLAQVLGGDLKLKWSTPGRGTCFEMQLPVENVADIGLGATWREEPVDGGPFTGRRVLVVDDSLDNRTLIGRTLEHLGAEISLAQDGLEAVQLAQSESFDVVLMDLQMPRLGGVEATRMMRQNGFSQPIVALTAQSFKDDRLACSQVGCTEYLTKPIQRQHLVDVLAKVVRPALNSATLDCN